MAKYLFLGAHPDDIELGAGGTLAKAIQSNVECHVIIFSDCHQSLESSINDSKRIVFESISALSILGVEKKYIQFLEFPVRNFPKYRQEILQHLIDRARSQDYSRVYVPSFSDIHQDHHVVCEESLRAFKFCTVLGYELPWNVYKGQASYFNCLDLKYVELKKLALREFYSQKARFYSGDENVETILKFRGLQIHTPHAEAFEILRWIER